MNSAWVKHAISEINADYQRSADTHLIRLPLPAFPGIHLYLKDESTHPTGSLILCRAPAKSTRLPKRWPAS